MTVEQGPVIIDLESAQLGPVQILRDHDTDKHVGSGVATLHDSGIVVAGTSKAAEMTKEIKQSAGPGTFSSMIANRLGFRGNSENEKTRTGKTEQAPAERKAQAEASRKEMDRSKQAEDIQKIQDGVGQLNNFWSGVGVV